MRGLEALFEIPGEKKPPPKPKGELQEEAIQLLKEERDALQQEVTALQIRILHLDKKVARQARAVRSAEVEAEVLLEAVSEFARTVTNDTRAGRDTRERVRKLLEANKIPPPSTLGSSRKRGKRTTESA